MLEHPTVLGINGRHRLPERVRKRDGESAILLLHVRVGM